MVGSQDPHLCDLSREGVRGGELGGSEGGLDEAMAGAPSARGVRKSREEAEETSGVD